MSSAKAPTRLSGRTGWAASTGRNHPVGRCVSEKARPGLVGYTATSLSLFFRSEWASLLTLIVLGGLKIGPAQSGIGKLKFHHRLSGVVAFGPWG